MVSGKYLIGTVADGFPDDVRAGDKAKKNGRTRLPL